MSQLVKLGTLGVSSGLELMAYESSPSLGSLFSRSLPGYSLLLPFLPLVQVHTSHFQINK